MTNDNEQSTFTSLGDAANSALQNVAGERIWDGKPITQPGVYSGISLHDYHNDPNLFAGPRVTKSSLKHILAPHEGSPNKFWANWVMNPNRIEKSPPSEALILGRAAHCILLGDEVFDDAFVVRPAKVVLTKTGEEVNWDSKRTECKDWLKAAAAKSKTVITKAQIETIFRMRDAASKNTMVQAGMLDGRIERTMVSIDADTGIFLCARPDAIPTYDGAYSDLKTASSFDEDFLTRQFFDAGYYLQGAMIRRVARSLGLPFEDFNLVYVLNDNPSDAAWAKVNDTTYTTEKGVTLCDDLLLGEQAITVALKKIRSCLDSGEWPGYQPFKNGERMIGMRPWDRLRLTNYIEIETRIMNGEAA